MELAQAQVVLAAVVRHADSLGVRVSCSITDAAGNEVLTARMPGAPFFTPHVARSKARTCVAMGMDSAELAHLDAAHPGLVTLIDHEVPFMLTSLGGGVVIRDGDAVLGAVAASGATPDQDAECARAGIAAIHLA